MAVSSGMPTSMRTVKRQVTQPMVYPAPLRGIDARVPLALDSFETCIWAINMVPTEYAMRARRGYREWQIEIGTDDPVRTIIPYAGSAAAGTDDRLFVATTSGIYDVTVYGAAPVQKFAFTNTGGNAGFGVYTTYVDESGDDLMFYADQDNGLFRYDPVAHTWAQATGITTKAGSFTTLDVTKVVFVVVHKLRMWLIEKNANKAWYLPIRSAMGDATEFFFASKFKYGGGLIGLYNWTVDGGQGRDDHLVAVSRSGDVIPWTGEDPSDVNTWTSTGTFHIGPVPEGHRVASEYGGELFLLSKYGITSMSKLMAGMVSADPMANEIGHKIARLLRRDLDLYGNQPGWAIKFVTHIGALLITMPKRLDGRYRQYVYNIATQGWGLWRDVPVLSADTYDGSLMVGGPDGRVHRMDVDRDNITIAGSSGEPIAWFLLTTYSHLSSPATFKRCKFVRPNFVAQQEPQFNITVFYDYQINEIANEGGFVEPGNYDTWGDGLWGEALWSFSIDTPFNKILGATGIGRSAAIAIAGSSSSQTDLISFDMLWENGGLL